MTAGVGFDEIRGQLAAELDPAVAGMSHAQVARETAGIPRPTASSWVQARRVAV
jgi:hypothetical protein